MPDPRFQEIPFRASTQQFEYIKATIYDFVWRHETRGEAGVQEALQALQPTHRLGEEPSDEKITDIAAI